MSASQLRAPGPRSSFVTYVLDQLSGLEDLGCRAMFGGHGLYLGRAFFGILFDDRLYFKTHADTLADYVGRGMAPFRPNDKHLLKTYFEVPADVLESPRLLAVWASAAARPAVDPRNGADATPSPRRHRTRDR